ncbi:hypothetical protein ACIRVK_03835 [Streptomyces sp. NPDC101152]|uniref:hypothetical protein n=1 Tax=Streptomyces sp. NPDC101152 TaxID=3366116 RepID=UPI003827D805
MSFVARSGQSRLSATHCDGLCLDPQIVLSASRPAPDRSFPCTRRADALPHPLEPDPEDVVAGMYPLLPRKVLVKLGVFERESYAGSIRSVILCVVLPADLMLQRMPPASQKRRVIRPGQAADYLLTLVQCWRKFPTPPVRSALLAALIARNAAIDGDVDQVDAFARTWLGLRRPEAWREAVEMALLGNWVEELTQGVASDSVLAQLLHRQARIEHRHLQPLWEHRVRNKHIVLLSQEIGASLTVEDLLIDRHTPETQALHGQPISDPIASVFRGLSETEAAIALQRAYSGDTWAAAAIRKGMPAAYGERVRSKLRRLGEKYTARRASANATTAVMS